MLAWTWHKTSRIKSNQFHPILASHRDRIYYHNQTKYLSIPANRSSYFCYSFLNHAMMKTTQYHTSQSALHNSDEESNDAIGKYTFKVNQQVEQYLKQARQKHQELSNSVYAGQPTKPTQFVELKFLTKVTELSDKFENLKTQLAQLEEMKQTEKDPELKQMAQEDYLETEKEFLKIQNDLIGVLLNAPQVDGNDVQISSNNNAIIEIRPGTGGDEASLFAMELFKMYEKYALAKGWKFEVLSLSVNCGGEGCREGIALISSSSYGGDEDSSLGVYGSMKFESGVHRVQRVPVTESQGRVHTSSASVVVLPEVTESDFKINLSDVKIETMRASGAGGQHVNTTDSAVRLTHIPTGTTVYIADERSQHRNKEKAFKILHSRLFQKQQDEKMQKMTSERKEQIGSGDRSEKIRTYNFPQDRITDHRISFTQYGLDKMMDGEILDSFVELLSKQQKIQQFTAMFEKQDTFQSKPGKKK
ncbi:hypothetical protein C9374_002641 [Naegleria lovaniensis]|uniref:Prokaryotic-type class I peptide chain release factors domain-containing protein n=1 Tax=Naegleria lovaniensis TaxID=51637 RepID=A0AA88GNU7_NAELO|nr:uncharacterized protein C9374_002641 [Naegleria lovaniensis]KAG2386195.1 hypothetical protein C9374_002641 [Naegleria lovaniensis]